MSVSNTRQSAAYERAAFAITSPKLRLEGIEVGAREVLGNHSYGFYSKYDVHFCDLSIYGDLMSERRSHSPAQNAHDFSSSLHSRNVAPVIIKRSFE